jgi:hypothetical protein
VANFDLTAAQGVFKRIQTKRLTEVLYSVDRLKNNPGFASLKSGKGNLVKTPFGEAYAVVVQTTRGGSTSADIDVAEGIDDDGTGSPPQYDQFLLTPSKVYTSYTVEGDVLDRCQDEGAFINAATKVVKDAMDAHVRKLCVLSHGTGTGKIGTITAVSASPAYIEVTPTEVRNIERQDRLVAAEFDVSPFTLRSSTALRVTKRNSVTGRIHLSSSPVALGWSVGDSLYWKGTVGNAYSGYFAWDPATEPDNTTFFNVDRSIDPVRLGGNRFDCADLGFREALIKASLAAIAEGAMPSRTRVSPEDYASICIESEQLPEFKASTTQGETTIGFKAVMLAGVGPVVYDESMPKGHFLMEEEDSWQMYSDDGELVKILSHDGLVFRKVSGDRWRITLKSLLQMGCDRPGRNLHGFNFGE